jgi:hypothetical protein
MVVAGGDFLCLVFDPGSRLDPHHSAAGVDGGDSMVRGNRGDVARLCPSANAAVMRAEALSRKPGCAGAIAFSRSGDPATGEFGDAKLIRKFGDVPDDLSALRSPLTLRANARERNAAFPSSRPALADRCRSRRDCRPVNRRGVPTPIGELSY